MNAKKKTAAALLLAGVGFASGGCLYVETNGSSGYSAHYRVSTDELDHIVRQNTRLRLGMHREDALSLYPEPAVSYWSSDKVDGYQVEEWRVRAYSRHKGTRFERWLYFVDERLVAFDQDSIDYRDPARVHAWASH